MTVKCVSNDLKPLIAHAYAVEGVDSETLALAHDVSKRTIQRILVEQGANKIRASYPRIKAPLVEPVSTRTPDLPIIMFEPVSQPLLSRLFQGIKNALAFAFK